MLASMTLGSNLDHTSIEGQVVDLKSQRIFPGRLYLDKGRIISVEECATAETQYLMPGLIDSHMHVESTLTTPAQIGAALLPHGIFASVSDPHEIANVLGIPGIDYMLADAQRTSFRILFGAPSCVPATNPTMETSGAILGAAEVVSLLRRDKIGYLAEVMNFPGVLNSDPALMQMIAEAKRLAKPIDGHAPGLSGEEAMQYAAAGIATDHECFSFDEAHFKVTAAGMKILIREGSAARNLDALAQIVELFPNRAMLCTDDLHPDLAVNGSINLMVKRLIDQGIDPLKVLTAACSNPNTHYGLGLGQLQSGDSADFIVVKNLRDFYASAAIKAGKVVGLNGQGLEQHTSAPAINNFNAEPISLEDIKVPAVGNKLRCIKAIDGQLITESVVFEAKVEAGNIVSDVERDILKIVVVNRYYPAKPSVAFIHDFKLKKGAVASSVAHDSHNIIAIGSNDEDLVAAINQVIEHKGALVYTDKDRREVLPLPVAGLMSQNSVAQTAADYTKVDQAAKIYGGTTLRAPFMTLSFMGLIVIPQLKISDKGLFENFQLVPVSFTE
jgi:adenine deaminase